MEQTGPDLIQKEQLAAQIIAVMDAHFTRPTANQKYDVLKRAEAQIRTQQEISESR